MHHQFPVSTKAALFNIDKSKVLLIGDDKGKDNWGLPGGHMQSGETPDQAIRRELFEECSVKPKDLRQCGFFMHRRGKIVLAYTGTVKDETVCSSQDEPEGQPKWLTKEQFDEIDIYPGYRQVVLDNWK
ncbi:hypothetical protein CR969_03230 [Candidatus Saccharibacteria bacterium]|nr:MAG: hypothetical protein CR969_03230 [Candidatus Saccharibacteria bacterium]